MIFPLCNVFFCKDMKKKSPVLETTIAPSPTAATAAAVTGGDLAELEELRAAKARLEKKLRESKKDYDELEKEVLALEEENAQLEEELKRANAK